MTQTCPNEETMTIREMSAAYDVTARTLRFYESKELLSPIRDGSRRLFTRRDRARLTLILRGKRFGFSLEELRQLLDLYELEDGQRTQLRQTYDIARQRLADLVRRRDELDDAIDDLSRQIDHIAEALAQPDGSGTVRASKG